MKHKYRILGIAPYEGMKALMSDVAEEGLQVNILSPENGRWNWTLPG